MHDRTLPGDIWCSFIVYLLFRELVHNTFRSTFVGHFPCKTVIARAIELSNHFFPILRNILTIFIRKTFQNFNNYNT